MQVTAKLNNKMSPQELAKLQAQAKSFNARLTAERKRMGFKPGSLDGRDRYLKLLLKQLQHQDPSNPIKNHQFAAQMAQFSALKQMTRLNVTTKSLLDSSKASGMYGMLGKKITWLDPVTKKAMTGIADSIGFAHGKPHLMIGGAAVPMKSVLRVQLAGKGGS